MNIIRKANNNDIVAIHSLLIEGAFDGKTLIRSLKEIESVINTFFVCALGHQIVGCCSLEIYSKKIAEIRSLAVTKRYRRQGIGNSLIQRCVAEAKKKRIHQVLSVTDKYRLFTNYGFAAEVNKKQALLLYL